MKRTIKYLGAITLILIGVAACYNGVIGNGNVETKVKKIDDFSRLKISGNFEVHLKQDRKPGLRIEADENLLDIIRVRQYGDELNIDTELNIIRAKRKILYITYNELDHIDLSGAMEIRGETPVDVDELRISVNGAVDIKLEVVADYLNMDVSGAVDCDFRGKVEELVLDLSGAGDFQAIELQCDQVKVEMSGAGSARVNAREYLRVDISGAGSVRYKGDPEISKSISGIGSLRKY